MKTDQPITFGLPMETLMQGISMRMTYLAGRAYWQIMQAKEFPRILLVRTHPKGQWAAVDPDRFYAWLHSEDHEWPTVVNMITAKINDQNRKIPQTFNLAN